MIVLSIDTSHPVGSVALARDGEIVASERFGGSGSHLLELGRNVDKMLGKNDLEAGAVGRIALVLGPGSFTGLRIGLAFVKGWYAGLGTQIVTKNTLELLALPYLDRWPVVCSMIDARKGEVYAAVYRSETGTQRHEAEAVVEPRALAPVDLLAEVAPFSPAFIGSGALRYKELAGVNPIAEGDEALPSTEYLCRIATLLEPLGDEQIRSLEPFYLRPSGAKLKRLKPIDPHA